IENADVECGASGQQGKDPVMDRHTVAWATRERRIGHERQEHAERQMDGARLGVVQHQWQSGQAAEREGQGGSDVELKQGPAERNARDDPCRVPERLSWPGVGCCHKILKLGVTQWRPGARFAVLYCHAGSPPVSCTLQKMNGHFRWEMPIQLVMRRGFPRSE